MSKRLAFHLLPQLLLCTSAFAQSPNATATTAQPTLWDHNGSVMYLVANGSSREMLEAGARPDAVLFKGQVVNGQLSGTAYLFNARCGQVPFEVKGPIPDNNERVVLTGQAPRLGRDCQAYGYYASALEFRLLKGSEVAQSHQPPPTVPDPRGRRVQCRASSSGWHNADDRSAAEG